MSQCNQSTYDESQFDDGLDEESVILTLVPVSEEPTTELPTEPIISSTVGLEQPEPPLPTSAKIKPSSPKPSSCLPAILPPINDVSRNTLREWCHHCNLSTDGKKIEVYLRLQRNSYSKQQIHIPDTSPVAKLRPKKHKEITHGSRPQNVKKRKEDEEDGVVEVLTSERDSVFAAWGRIAMKASQPRAMNCQPLPSGVKAFLPPASGCRWCVVHGRLLPADKTGWVSLQMHASQTWVPYTPQRMISLFLLPACVFPSPRVEDNMLCPECVQSNKNMMRSFLKDKRSPRKSKMLPPNLPPYMSGSPEMKGPF